jgi:ligand-binding sensor domain-containing protein/signal transduction histidine kinase
MFGRTPLLLVIALAQAVPAAAQGRSIDRWSVEQGLPNNALASILQTRDGYLWIATWAGTVRFDGVRFTPIATNLPNDHARALFEDEDGSVWIGVAGSGLVRWRDNGSETFTVAQGLAGNDARTIVQDEGGRVWVGTENGLSIVEAGAIRTLRVAQGLPDNSVTNVALARNGDVWVATLKGVCRASAATSRCSAADLRAHGRADAVLEDRAGRVWIGSPQGLFPVHGDHPVCGTHCLTSDAVTTLRETRDGDIWAGFGSGGVARLHAAGIDVFGENDGLPKGNVVAMLEDAEGSLWVATYYGGLARIKPKRVRMFSTADGLTADAVGSIVQDRNGDIWAGAQCGPISVLRQERFVPQFAAEMRGACAWAIWPTSDGSLWIGTRGNGLYRWNGKRLDHFDGTDGLSDLHIAALFEDRDGTIWIGTELGGLHTYRDGRLSRAYGNADGVATPYIASFAQDRDGRVWIGSNANGLSVYEHGRFRTLPPEESPPTRNISGLLIDSRGDLWIGSAANGLFRRRNGRYEPFGLDQGLGDRLVAVVIEDRDANLWVGTARGISRLTRERIEAVAEGRAASLDPIILDAADGMRNAEGSGGGHDPSGLRDREGRLWFSTIDGIAVIDPESFVTNRVAPAVLVESARLDDRPATRRADGSIEVPPGTSAIEIAYTAFSFLAPSKVQFRYRLAGYDETWHSVGSRRAAYYSRLPPGDYTLEVMASNNDGVWSTMPATMPLVVLPFIWERAWVQATALVLLLILTGGVVRVVTQRAAARRVADLERAHALERERTRIARDLHDDLGSRLALIAMMTERGMDTKQVSTAVRTAVESLDELVWTVNARHDTIEGFAAYAARFAEEHVGAAGLRLRLHFAPDLPATELRAETRRHLYLAYKEAVHNAVKHAQATEIQVTMTLDDATLTLEVADDGLGLQGPGDPTGNGLTNMRERLESIGGTVEIKARPAGGVSVVFRAPVAAGTMAERA